MKSHWELWRPQVIWLSMCFGMIRLGYLHRIDSLKCVQNMTETSKRRIWWEQQTLRMLIVVPSALNTHSPDLHKTGSLITFQCPNRTLLRETVTDYLSLSLSGTLPHSLSCLPLFFLTLLLRQVSNLLNLSFILDSNSKRTVTLSCLPQ